MKSLQFALGSAALAVLMTPVAVSANTIVDTGTPVGTSTWTLGPTGSGNQALAGYFTVGSATTITGFQGYIDGFLSGGSVTATLYSDGVDRGAGAALFSTTFSVGAGEGWDGATVSWGVGAANYWLGFFSNDSLGMRNGAPAPLPAYAFTTENGQWQRYDYLDIGIRVFDGGAVPEPGTWALLLIGFGAIGAGMRARRRTRVTIRYAA